MHVRGFLLGLLLSGGIVTAADSRPNILYIMADDHAAHAISAYGSRLNQTPNIDRLARGGAKFTRCLVTNSLCTPSRASILTGKYSHMNGVPVVNTFNGAQPHLAKHLQAAGYHTGMIGKWDLFSKPTGFDDWNVLAGPGIYHDPVFYTATATNTHPGYVTDLVTQFSLEFLKNRPANRPFFLMCHHKAPHRNWEPAPKYARLYEDVSIPEPETLFDDYATRSPAAAEAAMRLDLQLNRSDLKYPPPPADLKGPELAQWLAVVDAELAVTNKSGQVERLAGDALRRWKYQRYIKDYLRCVKSVDDSVGELLDYLDKSGLAENTIVIYTSDQGFFLGEHDWFDKRFMYEESLRMPFLIRWPALIKPGTVNERMILNVDFAPTLLAAARQPIPADMQGRSFFPMLRGEVPADWRTSAYYRYYHYPQDHKVEPHYGVITGQHKLIYFWRIDAWELYDLAKDPHELNNLYASPAQAETVKKLKAELYRLKTELKDEDQYSGGFYEIRRTRKSP